MSLSDFQNKILEMSSKTKGCSGFAAKSSIRHINRSFKLAESMPEVSAFLAITAEEEAATALFAALKNKRYARSKELKKMDHKHKGGVYPFLALLGETLEVVKHELPYQMIVVSTPKGEQLRVELSLGEFSIQPEPPLNLISVDASGNAKNYLKDIRKVASEKGIASIFEHIKDVANIRNQMLYASECSLPSVSDINSVLQRHIGAALLIHMIYLLVIQHSKQNLVEECVDVYLKIQHRLEHET